MLKRRHGADPAHPRSAADRFARSNSGTSALEFALILPTALVLWAGLAEGSRMVNAYRKATILARTVADLTSQGDIVDPMAPATMADILAASTAVLRPLSGSSAQIVISSMGVYATNLINPKVCSSTASSNTTARATGVATDLTIPTVFSVPGDRYLLAEVNMTYTPMVGNAVIKILGWSKGTISMKTSFVWPVRNGTVHNSTSSPASPEVTMPNGAFCS